MIVKDYIKSFEKHGLGMFVHFGVYSVLGEGEWARHNGILSHEEYDSLYKTFNPTDDWAKKLVDTANAAGCRYITLTTRHHDGFSLYDTCGLSNYDAPHALAGRDLVREFVDACCAQNIIPFFYHTLLDWYVPSYNENFKEYLVYLRKSVALLCQNYGEIGGIWFDGMWNKPNEDWEEDALYALIRHHQPSAMIINNTGLDARGALGHIELDSVTFERGRPTPINLETSPKYIASEMCQIFGDHWGYAKHDYHYKSLSHIIADYCACRRYGANFLLNVGPMESGYLRPLDDALLRTLGEWIAINQEALYLPRPSGIEIEGNPKNFILQGENAYYLFFHDLEMGGSSNVVASTPTYDNSAVKFMLEKTIQSVKWLDEDTEIQPSFTQNTDKVEIHAGKQRYGVSMVVRVAKITV
ncbi:MAG: alpha-L-fucosidase [Clostridia bacterium]|nr:alpha-L-fucosidase [Clostridia bacterium]